MITRAKSSGLKYEIVELLEGVKDRILESGDLTEIFLLALQASETLELSSPSGDVGFYSKEDVIMSISSGKLIIQVIPRPV